MATSIPLIRKRLKILESIKNFDQFSHMLAMDDIVIFGCANSPKYKSYKIPKKMGYRLIEDPENNLKYIQGVLNDLLQAAYYYVRPDCVYGFCISSMSDAEDKNIISNARQHLGCQYMLNMDLLDFFHQVTKERVEAIFKEILPNADQSLTSTLSGLCTYKGRLPMGAPTSPILSNYALMSLDHELMGICQSFDIKYTRYADDLTFSSEKIIGEECKGMIEAAIAYNKYKLNPRKIKLYAQDDQKIVTGLVVTKDDVTLQDGYLDDLTKEAIIYKNVKIADQRYRTGMSERKLEKFKQELQGKINFASMVDAHDIKLSEIIDIVNSADDLQDISFAWLEIPYMAIV